MDNSSIPLQNNSKVKAADIQIDAVKNGIWKAPNGKFYRVHYQSKADNKTTKKVLGDEEVKEFLLFLKGTNKNFSSLNGLTVSKKGITLQNKKQIQFNTDTEKLFLTFTHKITRQMTQVITQVNQQISAETKEERKIEKNVSAGVPHKAPEVPSNEANNLDSSSIDESYYKLSEIEDSKTDPFSKQSELPLMEYKDQRSVWQKIWDRCSATLKLSKVFAGRAGHKLFPTEKYQKNYIQPTKTDTGLDYKKEDLPWNNDKESDGLYLFVHGLNGFPSDWEDYVQQIDSENQSENKKMHFVAPYVPERGNCSLKTAAAPFLELVENYAKKFPGKPIYLFGTSNGGRIISYIESKIKPELMKDRPISLVSIAGVHYGTHLINLLSSIGLGSLLLNKTLLEEFHWGSERATKLLRKWNAKQDVWDENNVKIRHLFITTQEDELVWSNTSSLPQLKGRCEYIMHAGENHQTIVNTARKEALKWSKSE